MVTVKETSGFQELIKAVCLVEAGFIGMAKQDEINMKVRNALQDIRTAVEEFGSIEIEEPQ